MLDWLESKLPQVRDLELGTGGYSQAPHCSARELVVDDRQRERWSAIFTRRGFRVAALNVSGNPLHPDPGIATAADVDLRATVRLAAELGIDRVVAMAGCPGSGPHDRHAPHFSAGAWLPDYEGVLEWQWQERILPYWHRTARWAAREHPELRICLELHPGSAVYNTTTFDWISRAGANLAINLDPSHLFWQGIDPLAVVERLGSSIGFVHGKDTAVDPHSQALNGCLDCRWPMHSTELTWNFAAVGQGHAHGWWCDFLSALRRSGYDGVVSIEHEDPTLRARDGVLASAAALQGALAEI